MLTCIIANPTSAQFHNLGNISGAGGVCALLSSALCNRIKAHFFERRRVCAMREHYPQTIPNHPHAHRPTYADRYWRPFLATAKMFDTCYFFVHVFHLLCFRFPVAAAAAARPHFGCRPSFHPLPFLVTLCLLESAVLFLCPANIAFRALALFIS